MIMIAYSGLIGLSFIYSTAGFTAGPISTPSRSKGSCGRACASYQSLARQQAPQLDAGWRLLTKQQAVRTWQIRAADGTGETEPAAEAAPRLKRVRKRRKDASSIATAGEDEDGIETSSPAVEQVPAAAVNFESARAEAAAVVAVEETEPQAVVVPVVDRKVEQAVEEAPRSAGDTRGTKVRWLLLCARRGCWRGKGDSTVGNSTGTRQAGLRDFVLVHVLYTWCTGNMRLVIIMLRTEITAVSDVRNHPGG